MAHQSSPLLNAVTAADGDGHSIADLHLDDNNHHNHDLDLAAKVDQPTDQLHSEIKPTPSEHEDSSIDPAAKVDQHGDQLHSDTKPFSSKHEDAQDKLFLTPEPEARKTNQQQLEATTAGPTPPVFLDSLFTENGVDDQSKPSHQLPSPRPSQDGRISTTSPEAEMLAVTKVEPAKPVAPVAKMVEPDLFAKPEPAKTEEAPMAIKAEPITGVKRSRLEPSSPSAIKKATAKRKRQRNDDMVEGYDESEEQKKSDLAVDKPCYPEANRCLAKVVEMVLATINSLRSEGYEEKEVLKIAQKLANDLASASRNNVTTSVGLLGDTASGKSSLINSLLNEDNLATEAEDGHSGTHVIHEFAMAEPAQTSKYVAKVYFHPDRRIEAMVKEHVADIFTFLSMDLDTVDEEEYADGSMKYNTAMDFFISLLSGPDSNGSTKSRFLNAEKTKEALAQNAGDKDTVHRLIGAINKYLDSLNRVKGETVIACNDMKELIAKKKIFAGPVKGSASPWPLVRKITIHINARILADGVILVDLPGVSDTNLTRVKATKDYIKSCDTIVIVEPMPRILSAKSIDKNIRECFRSGKISKTIVACTKIDGFNHERERTELSAADKDYLQDLKQTAAELKNEVDELEDQRDAALEADEMKEYKELKRIVEEKKQQLADAQSEVREGNIMIRNGSVTHELQEKVHGIVGRGNIDAPMKVFCVSNTIYQVHRKGYSRDSPPELTVESTGIPPLRAHLAGIPAREKIQKFTHICNITVPMALTALDLQCSKSQLERKQDVLPKIQEPMTKLGSSVNQVGDMLKTELQSTMMNAYTSHWPAWRKSALASLLKDWTDMHWARFLTFCRKDGLWQKDKDSGPWSWNNDILEVSGDDCSRAIARAKKTFTQIASELQDVVDAHLNAVVYTLNHSEELMGMDMTAVLQSVELTRDDGKRKVQALFRKLEAEMLSVSNAANSAEDENSHIYRSMLVAYEQARQISGTGSHTQRKAIIKAKLIGQENVFLDNMHGIIAHFDVTVDEWAKVAEDRLGEAFSAVLRNFNLRFDNEEVEDETRKAFRLRLLQTVKAATLVKDTELKAQVLECEKWR